MLLEATQIESPEDVVYEASLASKARDGLCVLGASALAMWSETGSAVLLQVGLRGVGAGVLAAATEKFLIASSDSE